MGLQPMLIYCSSIAHTYIHTSACATDIGIYRHEVGEAVWMIDRGSVYKSLPNSCVLNYTSIGDTCRG